MVAPGSAAWHKHGGHISGNGKNPERLRETIPAWVSPFLEIIHLLDKFGLVVTKPVFITLREIIPANTQRIPLNSNKRNGRALSNRSG